MRPSYIEPLEARIAPATLAITPLIVDEGDEGTVDKVKHIQVTLDQAAAGDVTVHYTLMDGTAHINDQFSPVAGQAADGTLTFTAGSTSAQIDVVINGNSVVNHDTSFSIRLDNITGGANPPAADGTVTIWDDDSTVDFSASSLANSPTQAVAEGSAAAPGHFQYSATLSAPADHPIQVTFKTDAHGSSYSDATDTGLAADYTAVTTTLTFAPGSVTSQNVTVNIKGDSLPGPDEVFNASLSKTSTDPLVAFGAKLGNVTTTSTILNDDGSDQSDLTASLVSSTVATSEGGNATFVVQLSRLSESPVLISYHTSDGATHTATAGSDYTSAVNATQSINGVLQDPITISVLSDTHVEGAETFNLTLDGATVNGAPIALGAIKTATATIAADPLPKLVFVQLDPTTHLPPASNNGDISVVESSTTAPRTGDFLVKLAYLDAQGNVDNNHHFDLTDPVTVEYTTVNGTATGSDVTTAGDYVNTHGTITFDANATDATALHTVSVPINADGIAEGTETFTLKLSNATGATIGDDTAVATIVDSNVVLNVSNPSVSEGNQGTTTAVFTIVPGKTIPTGYQLVVDYATKNGTATGTGTAGTTQDYQPLAPGQLTFDASTPFHTLSVLINGDTVIEGNENFTLDFSNARIVPVTPAGSVGTSVDFAGDNVDSSHHAYGTATIVSDDGHAISASITANAATQPEGAGTTANFNVHLSQMYSSPITVSYTVNKSSTTDPVVFTNSTSTFIIPAYTQDAALPIDYVNDSKVGHDQSITVTLNSLVSGDKTASVVPLVSAKTAKTTVLEDDFYVQVLDKSAPELNSGTSPLAFAVQLVDVTGALVTLDHAVSVPFHTIDGTGATGAVSTGTGADFLARTGTVLIPAGQKEQPAVITIRGDANVGGDETFSIQLGTPTGGQLFTHDANAAITGDHSKAIGTIVSDDTTPAPTVTVVKLAAGVEADPAHGIAGSPATFQVKLSAPSEQPITFDYATSVLTSSQNGDLAAQTDFTATNGSGTIASGETSTIISVPIVADSENENAEQFGLTVSNIVVSSNAAGSTVMAEGTIAASNQPTISVANASAFEGQSGQTNLTFTVQLSAPTDQDVSFYVETLTAGTATSGVDYVPLAKQLVTIGHGQSSVMQNVVINGDMAGEPNETFIFHVSGAVNATAGSMGVVDAVGTILNDDATFTIAPAATVKEQDGSVTLTVSRTGDTAAADVTFETINGTGATGAVSTGAFPDFVGGPGTIHFADGQMSQQIKIGLIDDNRHEANETFSVHLTGSNNGIIGTSADTAVVTIQDNDAIPTATLSTPAAVLEKDSGTTNVTFTVTLDHANDASDILLTYSTANGSATAGQDYVSVTNQHLTIEKGLLSKTFTVQVINDTTYDSLKTETFQVNLGPDPAYTGDATVKFANNAPKLTGTVSIIDNEVAPQVSIANASFQEGSNSNFNVTLNHPSDKPITVPYSTINGTAVAGADFSKTATATGKVTFAPGVTSVSLGEIAAETDTLVEGNETFKVQLAAPTGATLSKTAAVATGTIVDTNHAYVSINDVSLLEGNSGTKDAIFTVSLDGDTAAPVTYSYMTGDLGSATAGQDYIAKSGTVTLGGPNGAKTAQIAVKVMGDLAKEGNETFRVYLSGSSVATLTTPYGTGTILNDGDTQPTLSVSSQALAEGDPSRDASGQLVSGDKTMTFTATLSETTSQDVTFHIKASEILQAANVARLGSDFVAPADTVYTITAGQTTKTFDITIKADQVFEPTEFFNVTLTNITGAQPGHAVGTGTIYDNDLYFSKQVIKWTDVDGDLVTLAVNKGNLGTVGFGFDTTPADAGAMGGRILQQLNLVSPQAALSFAHANLSITATQQPNAAGVLVGDGRVNVGYIRANNYDSAPTVLELQGIDLANVVVDGDLSRINVGDLYSDAALGVLSVYSIGLKSATTEVGGTDSTGAAVAFHGVAQSQIIAGANTIKVANDISGQLTVTGGTTGRIGNLIVGGALRGTDDPDSARILTTGAITKASFHDIIGGAGARSAELTQGDTTASLGSLTVTGNITAGTGIETAHILFPTIGSVTIGGSLTGSGTTGGGFISASGTLGSVTIDGNFQGGARIYGGGLGSNQAIKSVIVHGNVNNAQIKGGYTANLVDTITTPSALEFAANADAQIGTVQIDGSVLNLDILAGTDPTGTANFNQDSAALFSRIAQVIFNGDILPNTVAHFISAQSIGTIIVQGASKTGSVAGTELTPGSDFLVKYA